VVEVVHATELATELTKKKGWMLESKGFLLYLSVSNNSVQ
jgi:hypothetical protein